MKPTVLQILPELDCGGVEQGTLDVATELVKNNHRSIVVSGPGRLVTQLKNTGSEHIELPVGNKSLFGLRLIPQLRNIFREQQVDIIHARSRFPAWLSYLAWRRMPASSRPFFMTTVHGPYSVNRYSKIMTAGERIIAISEYIKQYICNNYPDVDRQKIHVIHRGISQDDYPYNYQPSEQWLKDWKAKHPDILNKFIVTLPGRVTRWKGHNDFIGIIANARARGLDIHGLVAGGANKRKQKYLQELQLLARNNNLQNDITFLGQRDDMKDIMSISHIVLSLAKIPEAFGRTALEALYLGRPVIAYNHGGAAEVLDVLFPNGKAEPGNIHQVVELIERFYRTTPHVPFKPAFTLQNMLDKTLATYNSFYN